MKTIEERAERLYRAIIKAPAGFEIVRDRDFKVMVRHLQAAIDATVEECAAVNSDRADEMYAYARRVKPTDFVSAAIGEQHIARVRHAARVCRKLARTIRSKQSQTPQGGEA